jgi:hypothetical protein
MTDKDCADGIEPIVITSTIENSVGYSDSRRPSRRDARHANFDGQTTSTPPNLFVVGAGGARWVERRKSNVGIRRQLL